MLNYKHYVSPTALGKQKNKEDFQKFISDSGTFNVPEEVWKQHKESKLKAIEDAKIAQEAKSKVSQVSQRKQSKRKLVEKSKRTLLIERLKKYRITDSSKAISTKESLMEEEEEEEIKVETFKEISFLGTKASRALQSQESFPESISTARPVQSETLGMGALNFAPLKLKRIYGRNENTHVYNLCGLLKSHVAYAASNIIVYYDYYQNRQSLLQGHKNKITCFAQERSHTYLASGAVGKNNLTIVWDIESAFPYKIFPAYSDGYGSHAVGFSDTDYIGTLGFDKVNCDEMKEYSRIPTGNENPGKRISMGADNTDCTGEQIQIRQIVKIWSLKEKSKKAALHVHVKIKDIKPEATLILHHGSHKHRELVFSHENPTHFFTSGEKSIYFYTWLKGESKIIYHVPKTYRKFMGKIINYKQSIWIKGNTILTATSGGLVLEWETPVPVGLQEPIDPAHNVKEYKRSYKISDVGLTTICAYKEFYVLGDEAGDIKFFDMHFRILRWTKTLYKLPISSISFNLTETPEWKIEMRESFEAENEQKNPLEGKKLGAGIVRDYTYGGTRLGKISETTIQRQPFICNDLVVSTQGGHIFYYHMNEGVIDRIMHGTFGPIVALDSSPLSNHIVISNVSGDVQMYDTTKHTLIFSGKIFRRKVEVTYLKFHPSSAFILFATTEGLLYFRRSFTFGAMGAPLDNCQYPIRRIVFSSCGMHLAHYDDSYVVTLYSYHSRRGNWQIKGKLRSHYGPIVDLIFFNDTKIITQRLFSLGQDRRLIEYDVMGSGGSVGVKVINISYTEQTNIPTAMSYDNPFPNEPPILIFANSDNKIRLYDQNCHKIRKTCQGPNYGSLITRMIPYTPASYKNVSKFIIMVLGNKIGLIKTPVDGNPFKYMAILGHPMPIIEACSGYQEQVYTCAMNDNCCFLWIPNIQALETSTLAGGSGSHPFKQIIDAGLPQGKSLVEDIENIFYHLMLKRAKTQEELLGMNVEIKIDDIPTVMRTCGFFLTEFQIDAILEEALFMLGNRGIKDPIYISFDDFLILFANHKTYPISRDDVYKAFEVLGEYNEQDELCISRNKFLEYITRRCEAINEVDLPLFIPSMFTSEISLSSNMRFRIPIKFNLGDESQYPSEVPIVADVKEKPLPSGTGMSSAENKVPDTTKTGVTFDPSPKIELLDLDMDSADESEETETIPEEEEIHPRHLPSDIKANDFIEQLLTDESYETIEWLYSKDNDMQELEKLKEQFKDVTGMSDIFSRWERRDQWRYFNTAFRHLRDTSGPLTTKLKIAIQLDRFVRTGKLYDIDEMLRQMRQRKEEMGEYEGEYEGEDRLDEKSIIDVLGQESLGFIKSETDIIPIEPEAEPPLPEPETLGPEDSLYEETPGEHELEELFARGQSAYYSEGNLTDEEEENEDEEEEEVEEIVDDMDDELANLDTERSGDDKKYSLDPGTGAREKTRKS